MNNCFYQMLIKDDIRHLLIKEIERKDWVEKNGFSILKLSPLLFKNTKIFELILKHKGTPLIFKMNPMTWYDWHTDETRTCAINMLLSGYDSKCFFGDRKNRDIVSLTELTYQVDTYYLLNTQVKHAVLNLSNTRYLLSIGFEHPNTYEDILNYYKETTNA